MKGSLNYQILLNIKNNKSNILIFIFLILFQIVFMIGISYYISIRSFWNDFMTNSYDFNLVYVLESEDSDRNELIHKLKSNEHVKDVFLYDEFLSFGVAQEFVSSNVNGEIDIYGTVENTKKIIYGEDIKSKYDIICPSNFLPDSTIFSGNYNSNNIIEISNKVGENFDLNFIGKYPVKFKLVGIFDASYDYSNPNICYTTHETLKELNMKYQSELPVDNMPIYVLLDNISNASVLLNYDEITEYVQMKEINREVGDKVIVITGICVILIGIILFIVIYFLLIRRIKNEYRNIGIFSLIGYSKSQIKRIFYVEIAIIYLLSYIFSFIVTYFILSHFVELFLKSDAILSLIHVSFDFFSIVLCFILGITLIYVSSKNALKIIEHLSIQELLYD